MFCTPMFLAALLTIAKSSEQTTRPWTDEWDKKNAVCMHNGILISLKKKEILEQIWEDSTVRLGGTTSVAVGA